MEDSRIVDLYLARDESAIKHSAENTARGCTGYRSA